MIFNLYIYNRHGTCLLFSQWNKEHQKRFQDEQKAIEHEKKNMFGLLFSMKNFVNSLSPYKLDQLENEPFYSFTTKEYKLHYYEALSGLRFVLTTDRQVGRQMETLKAIYRMYVDDVVKNPFYQPLPDTDVDSPAFVTKLESFIRALPFFSTTPPIE